MTATTIKTEHQQDQTLAKDVTTELRYLIADSNNLQHSLKTGDFVQARRLIQAIRKTTDNLAIYTEKLAEIEGN